MIIKDEVLPALIFFNEEEARIVEAITARIIPGDPGNPGAKEAGAVIYIDRALAGFFSPLHCRHSTVKELPNLSETVELDLGPAFWVLARISRMSFYGASKDRWERSDRAS